MAAGGPVVLNQHKGAAIRGALFSALRKVGCSRQELTSCRPCELVANCPISFLLATVDDDARRGGDVPRPFTVEPPLGEQNIFEPGQPFNFGLTLFASSVDFWPYLAIGLGELERDGLGVKHETGGRWRRGGLRVREMLAGNPLSGEEQPLFRVGQRQVDAPELAVTPAQVSELIGPTDDDPVYKLHLTFLTPTRLVAEGKPLPYMHLPTLVQRLTERLSSLSRQYGAAEMPLDYEALMAEANAAVVDSRVRWQELRGYSHRQHQDLSLAGFVGEATVVGRVRHLLPLLIWGQLTHVGKDATKGNGWYSLKFEKVAA